MGRRSRRARVSLAPLSLALAGCGGTEGGARAPAPVPTAALLEVGYWDGQDSQELRGRHGVESITDPAFRRRFDAQVGRAVGILSAGGARVYLPTIIDNDTAQRARRGSGAGVPGGCCQP